MTTEPAGAPCTSFDHHDPDLAPDPFPIYAGMRERCPVAHSNRHGGFWVVSRYRDVVAVAGDPATFSSSVITHPQMGSPELPALIPAEIDPPAHGHYRRIMERMLTPSLLTQWEPEIRCVAATLIDEFIERGQADLMDELAVPFPIRVLSLILGIPLEGNDDFHDWQVKLADAHEDQAVQLATGRQLLRFLECEMHDRQEHPEKSDLLSTIVHSTIQGRPLTHDEIQMSLLTLVMVGTEPLTCAAGSMLWYLATHPDLKSRLVSAPSVIPATVDEFLRYLSPVQNIVRTTTRDVKIGGVRIPEGERLLLLWASANRDPDAFGRADEFLLDRDPEAHLAFGAGPHRCVGAGLARLELRILLEQVLRRAPDFQLGGGVTWKSSVSRGVETLPVTFLPGERELDRPDEEITLPTPTLTDA